MKGTIKPCLAELVTVRFGPATWRRIVDEADRITTPSPQLRIALSDVEDVEVLALIDATCRVLGLTLQEVADLVGEYWCCTFAPGAHDVVWSRFGSARACIEGLDGVQAQVMADHEAHPPVAHFDWQDDRTLLVGYRSERGLIDLYVGLLRGVGKAVGEPLQVTKVTSSEVEVVFA